MNRPNALAFDAQGRVFVSDFHNQRIAIFDREGRRLGDFGEQGLGTGKLWKVWGVRPAPDNAVYVLNHRITTAADEEPYVEVKVFGPDHRERLAFPVTDGFSSSAGWPSDLALAADGSVAVVDQQLGAVLWFDPQGHLLRSFRGPDAGQPLDNPRGIALFAGGFWVVEEYPHRLRKFTADGTQALEIGGEGSEPGRFLFPQSIDIAGNGDLLVADLGNYRVQRFSAGGEYLREYRPKRIAGRSPPQLLQAVFGPDEHVYVADSKGNRVIVFAPDGMWVRDIR
ncbi:MAG: NHL repeat-containing protein [Candidatus Schekmanbacteria bacterium]|nr:NHL repeat-containing protein [Candidatus Schekmanbacteria bacterium]